MNFVLVLTNRNENIIPLPLCQIAHNHPTLTCYVTLNPLLSGMAKKQNKIKQRYDNNQTVTFH